MEEAIGNEVAALKRDLTADAMHLLRQVETESKKHIVAVDDAIGAIERDMNSSNELIGAIDSLRQSEDVGRLLRGFSAVHSCALDHIQQHQLQKQVVVEIAIRVCRLSFFVCFLPPLGWVYTHIFV